MLHRIGSTITYANVMATVAVFLALGGGAYAAAASIGSEDIKDGAVLSRHIKNGEVSAADLNQTIPSGVTVVGAFGGYEDDGHGTGAIPTSTYKEVVDLHGLRAPVAITGADVSFSTSSALVAAPKEDSAACTGSSSNPTAPAGKVCLYAFLTGVDNDSAFGDSIGSTVAAKFGFSVRATDTRNRGATLRGVWAYQAP